MAKEINSDLLRGNINTIILKALYSGDRYGYDIVNEVEQKSHGQLVIKQPTLYSCLKRLETQGLVSSYWGEQSGGGRRKYFSLTEMGKEVCKQSQDDYEYSRTVIDKLISDNEYDLGNNDYRKGNAVISQDEDNQTIDTSVPVEDLADNSVAPVTDGPASPDNEMFDFDNDENSNVSDDDGSLNADDNESNITTIEEKKSLFDSYIAVTDSDAPVITHQIDDVKPNLSTPEITDKTPSIDDIFEKNLNNKNYLNDIKSSEVTGSSALSDQNMFSSDYSDVLGDSTISATKTPYVPKYSDDEYPYADSTDQGVAKIESELSPSKKEEKSDFIGYHDEASIKDAVESINETEEDSKEKSSDYQDMLAGLVNKFGDDNSSSDVSKDQIANNALEVNNKVRIKVFGNIVESARNLGEEVSVRTNDNLAKHQYTSKYYYNDNLLRLFENGILFIIMLIESLICYSICKNVFLANGQFDLAIFILSIVVALILPIFAGLKYMFNPTSKKRIESDFSDSFVFKMVVFILISLLSFGLNLFMGMPLSGNIADYSISLLMPIILSTNFPLSCLVFKMASKTSYFTVKD